MNKLDYKILNILRDDARISPDMIATMINADVQTVKSTIQKLEEEGIIVKYFTLLNQDKIVEDSVDALIEVKVLPQKQNGFDAIAEEISRYSQVKSVYLMSGAYDLLVIVNGRSLKEVALFVSERLSTLESVQSTATHFILKKFKVEGVSLDVNSEVERLDIQI